MEEAQPACPQKRIEDIVIRLAGNSQDGIQTIGNFLARLAGRSDQEVMTYMTIPATISGGPSIFQVHMGSGDVLSPGDLADFLVAFYQHSYEDHIEALRPGGILLYDSDHVKPNLEDKRFLYLGMPLTSLTIEAVGGGSKGKNMYTMGVLARVFGLNVTKLKNQLTERFENKGQGVLRNALMAFQAGYSYHLEDVLDHFYRLETGSGNGEPQVTMDGNQAIAYGLITGGVRHGSAYPITPWTTVMETLHIELPKYGGVFVQAEDEIAAISIAIGFSYSGCLAVTGTSGPGMSLKSEALGWACMAEIPLVIVNVQRGGPSTGLPTAVEQSDLLQAVYGSHGDAPRVVLAPCNVEDCFYTAVEAVRIAREYSTPVIILSDQSLSTRVEAFREPHLNEIMLDPKADFSDRPADFLPYPFDRITRHAPPGTRMESGVYPTLSGLEHHQSGHPTADPQRHVRMTAKRREKLQKLAGKLPLPEVFGDERGDILLVGWGSTWGPVREAVIQARKRGESIGHLHLKHLHPLPSGLRSIFSRYRQIFVVEMNDQGLYGFGQLATILRARYCNHAIRSISKTDGLSFKVREILAGMDDLKSPRSASVSSYPYQDD